MGACFFETLEFVGRHDDHVTVNGEHHEKEDRYKEVDVGHRIMEYARNFAIAPERVKFNSSAPSRDLPTTPPQPYIHFERE